MRRLALGAAVLAIALFGASGAQATTWLVSCTNGTIAIQGGTVFYNSSSGLDATDTLGTLLGTPAGPPTPPVAPAPGDTIEIGGQCTQDITITIPQLTLVSSTNPLGGSGDGDDGQIEIAGAQGILFLGLTLGSNSTVTFASANDQALLYAHDGAGVTMQYSVVENSSLFGILAAQSSTVSVLNSSVTTNGSTTDPQTTGGISATNGSIVILDAPDTSAQVTEVQFNRGNGVAVLNGSTLLAQGGTTISANNSGTQILVAGDSSAHVVGGVVDGSTCITCGDAIDLLTGSSLRLDGGAEVFAGANESAISASAASGILTSGSIISAAAGVPIINASDNSIIALAGGNFVCSGTLGGSAMAPTCAAAGAAVEIEHVSTFVQISPAEFDYPQNPDAIFGAGTVQLQSTIDLGLGLFSSANSLTWTTGSGGIAVSQNSSFRLQGGTAITGTLSLSEGSNGFFNIGNGGTNAVSTVICPFTAMPAARVSAPANGSALTPMPSLSTNFFSTASPQCLSF